MWYCKYMLDQVCNFVCVYVCRVSDECISLYGPLRVYH
jgi:hypothetical protein